MQLFSTILAVAASLFMIVSADEFAQKPERKSRASVPSAARASSPSARPSARASGRSGRSSRRGHQSSVIGGDSSVWGPSLSSSDCLSSSSSWDCRRREPCYSPCAAPFVPGYSPLAPNPLLPYSPCAAPCASPCASPCDPYGPREQRVGRVQPWYIYLTATYSSTLSSTTTVLTSAELTSLTVSYTIISLAAVPTTFFENQVVVG